MRAYTLEKYKKSRRLWFRIKIALGVLFLFAVCLGAWYAVYLSPLTTEFSVTVEGTNLVSREDFFDARPHIASVRLPPNILFLDPLEAEARLLKKYPRLAAVRVEKNVWKRAVYVRAKDRQREMVWCVTTQCYWIDSFGIAFEEAPDVQGLLIVKIHDGLRESLPYGGKVIDSDTVPRIGDFVFALNARGIPWTRIDLKSLESYEVWITLMHGTIIKLGLRTISQELIDAFFEVMNSVDLANTEYVDLTVVNRIYYKQK